MSENPGWVKRALHRNSVKAEDYISDPNKLQRLLNDVQQKTHTLSLAGTPFGALADQGGVLWRMLRTWQKGEYHAAPRGVLISAAAALLYFIMPWDVVPDFLVGLGLTDDAVLVAFVIRSIRSDLDKFTTWETVQKGRKAKIVDGKVAYVVPETSAPAAESAVTASEPAPVAAQVQSAESIPVENLDDDLVDKGEAEPAATRPWWRFGKRGK